jgi:hypothetical protein
MLLDRVMRNAQLASDLLGRLPGNEALETLALSIGQLRQISPRVSINRADAL